MSRDAGQRVADILHAVDRCQRYASALASESQDLVDMAEDAIERNLQIIGEAANHLPAEIAWPQIRGFRNILVHHYFGVDADIVHEVVERYLPPLAEALRQHVAVREPDSRS